MKFKISYSTISSKQLEKLPAKTYFIITAAIDALQTNPLPPDTKKMKGYTNYYRIRKDDYRIVYRVQFNIVTITVIQIGHRKDVYDNLI